MGTSISIGSAPSTPTPPVVGLMIPEPQIEIVGGGAGGALGQLNRHDTVNVYVRDVDPAIYARNPEIWLFRYKKKQRRGGSNNSHTSPAQFRKWVHPNHQGGKVGWSAGGGARFDNAGVPLPNFTTESPLLAEYVRTNWDLGEFFTTTGSAPVYTAPGTSFWANPPGQGGNQGFTTSDVNRLKQFFHFAITIDDPADPMHRIVGPRSARIIVVQEHRGFDPTGINVQRLKYYVDQSWARGQ